jgi:hypothetical protein
LLKWLNIHKKEENKGERGALRLNFRMPWEGKNVFLEVGKGRGGWFINQYIMY